MQHTYARGLARTPEGSSEWLYGGNLSQARYSPMLLIRPPLSKKLFPVSRVGKKKASREVGNLCLSPNFFFLYIRMYRGGKVKKKKKIENRKKKVPVGPF